MITIEFVPWGRFRAQKDNSAIRRWLQLVANASEEAFKGGMGSYPPASSPGSYPSSRTGRLKGSIRTEVGSDQMSIGTNMHYSIYLRTGTKKMARRKMSDNALQEGLAQTRGRLEGWVKWVRG